MERLLSGAAALRFDEIALSSSAQTVRQAMARGGNRPTAVANKDSPVSLQNHLKMASLESQEF
jgi:hypothetical protein